MQRLQGDEGFALAMLRSRGRGGGHVASTVWVRAPAISLERNEEQRKLERWALEDPEEGKGASALPLSQREQAMVSVD